MLFYQRLPSRMGILYAIRCIINNYIIYFIFEFFVFFYIKMLFFWFSLMVYCRLNYYKFIYIFIKNVKSYFRYVFLIKILEAIKYCHKIYLFVKVVRPIFLPSILLDEQCIFVLSKISIEPNSHS